MTIGNFDGVHRGHRALLDEARALATRVGTHVCVYTFDPPPRDVMRPGNDIPRIQSLDDKLAHLAAAGADEVVVEPFDRPFAARTALWFAQEVLLGRLNASGVVIGWDFRFGCGREGDADFLDRELALPVIRFGPFTDEHGPVSSSRVRQAIRAGDVVEGARLLGRPHEVLGPVVSGDRRGRQLGFPTANVDVQTPLRPPPGVYAVRVDTGDGVWRPGVANLGVRPTVGEGRVPLEVHLLDWSGDLYGASLRTAFVARIRDEQAFSGLDALVARIAVDVAEARRILGVPA